MAANPPSKNIADILSSSGIGVWASDVATDWAIVVGDLRDDPNTQICIMDSPGRSPEPGLDINYPSVQIIVRTSANDYLNGWYKCRDIRDVLLGRPSEERDGDVWASCVMAGDIMSLGKDENGRPLLAMNFDLIIHQGDLTNSHRTAC